MTPARSLKFVSIRNKIFLSFLLVILFYAASAVVNYRHLRQIQHLSEHMVPYSQRMKALHEIDFLFESIEKNVDTFLLLGDSESLERYYERTGRAVDVLKSLANDAQLQLDTTRSERPLIMALQKSLVLMISDMETMSRLKKKPAEFKAVNELTVAIYRNLEVGKRGFESVLTNDYSRMRADLEEERALVERVTFQFILLGWFIVGVAVMISIWLSRYISSPIVHLRDIVNKVSEGRRDVKIDFHGRDEIGQLATAFNTMVDTLRETTVSRGYLNKILANVENVLIVLDFHGQVKNVNPAACTIMGYSEEEFLRKRILDIFSLDDGMPLTVDMIWEVWGVMGSFRNYEFLAQHKNGKRIPMLLSISLVEEKEEGDKCYICVAQDISNLKEAENSLKTAYAELRDTQSQLIHSEKMAGVGQLAAGVAHEINNPAAFVLSNLENLSVYVSTLLSFIDSYEDLMASIADQHPDAYKILHEGSERLRTGINFVQLKDDVLAIVNESLDGLNRIRKIVENLRYFAHPGHDQYQLTDINAEIEKAINLVWNELKYKCQVVRDFGAIPFIHANPLRLTQVFVNLLVNAAQAIPGNQGIITIRTCSQDAFVVLEFADNGQGIPPENLQKVFSPFFTTKEVGKGTGLGLSVVYGIIKEHQGTIEVKSEMGAGTVFTIKLPFKQTPGTASSV